MAAGVAGASPLDGLALLRLGRSEKEVPIPAKFCISKPVRTWRPRLNQRGKRALANGDRGACPSPSRKSAGGRELRCMPRSPANCGICITGQVSPARLDLREGPMMKRWLEQLIAKDKERRRAERQPAPPLVVYYWDGAAPAAHAVRDVSLTGMYLATEQRWYPNTLIRMTVVRTLQSRGGARPFHPVDGTDGSIGVRWRGIGIRSARTRSALTRRMALPAQPPTTRR